MSFISEHETIIFFTTGRELGVRPSIKPLHILISSDQGIFITI